MSVAGIGKRYTALVVIVLLALVCWSAFTGSLWFVGLYETYYPSPQWAVGWFALIFFLCWWIVYLQYSEDCPHDRPAECDELWREEVADKSIITLRTFLEFNTDRGRSRQDAEANLARKAGQSIQTVGTIVAISLLILSFTINSLLQESGGSSLIGDVGLGAIEDPFVMITSAVLLIQIAAVVQFLISVDSLDTSLNEFSGVTGENREVYWLTRGFYVRGIKRYYNGLVFFVFSLFLLIMVVAPIITSAGVAIFAVLGYNYWFGYTNDGP